MPKLSISQTRTIFTWGLATVAVYGSFVVMATYASVYLECDHCRRVAWQWLPYGPGWTLLILIRGYLRHPLYGGYLDRVYGLVLSIMLLVVLQRMIRNGGWSFCFAGATLIMTSFLAMMFLAFIRA